MFVVQLAIFAGGLVFILGNGWVDYFSGYHFGRKPPGLLPLVGVSMFFPLVFFVFFRAIFIRSYLRPKFERIILEEDEIAHINYRGKEDMRIRYDEVLGVEATWTSEPGVEATWRITSSKHCLVLSSALNHVDVFWDRFGKACKVPLPANCMPQQG